MKFDINSQREDVVSGKTETAPRPVVEFSDEVFERLAKNHMLGWRYLKKMHAESRDDIRQQALTRCLEKRKEGRLPAGVAPEAVYVNTIRDIIKEFCREENHYVNMTRDDLVREPEDVVANVEMSNSVEKILATVTPQSRRVLELRMLDLTRDEILKETGLSRRQYDNATREVKKLREMAPDRVFARPVKFPGSAKAAFEAGRKRLNRGSRSESPGSAYSLGFKRNSKGGGVTVHRSWAFKASPYTVRKVKGATWTAYKEDAAANRAEARQIAPRDYNPDNFVPKAEYEAASYSVPALKDCPPCWQCMWYAGRKPSGRSFDALLASDPEVQAAIEATQRRKADIAKGLSDGTLSPGFSPAPRTRGDTTLYAAGDPRRNGPNLNSEANTTAWEYTRETLAGSYKDLAAKMSADGWELVTWVGVTYFFKRPTRSADPDAGYISTSEVRS